MREFCILETVLCGARAAFNIQGRSHGYSNTSLRPRRTRVGPSKPSGIHSMIPFGATSSRPSPLVPSVILPSPITTWIPATRSSLNGRPGHFTQPIPPAAHQPKAVTQSTPTEPVYAVMFLLVKRAVASALCQSTWSKQPARAIFNKR